MIENEETHWMSIADIMSALMMVFMFISISFLYQLLNKKEIYKVELNKALHKEFDKDLQNWKAIITDDNIFRFNAPFKIGDDTIGKDFKGVLANFFPRYIKLLSSVKFKKEIDEIRVEGHTSKDWGKLTQKEAFIHNMNLSQKRASSVLKFCYNIDDKSLNKHILWLQSILRANGMSFSKLLYKDAKNTIPDKIRSRRVEFKVITKEYKK